MVKDFLRKVEEAVEANYSNPNFGAKDLACELGMSQSALLKKVKTQSGITINRLIREYRLRKAQEILNDSEKTVAEAAFSSGFRSQTYFSTSFRKFFGYPPGKANGPSKINIDNENKNTKPRGIVITFSAIFISATGILIFLFTSGILRQEKKIAVLPFSNIGQQTLSLTIGEILRKDLIYSLSQVGAFSIRSAQSSGMYGNSKKSVPKIGKELDVQYLINGSVDLEGNDIKLVIQVVDAKKDNYLLAIDTLINLDEIYSYLTIAAEQTVSQLHTRLLPSEKRLISSIGTQNAAALKNYMLGISNLDNDYTPQVENAIIHFKKAIELEPTWANPYTALSLSNTIIYRHTYDKYFLDESFKYASKAHEIQPGPETYHVLARYYRELWEFKKAAKMLRKALRIDPEDMNAHLFMAKVCSLRGKWKRALSHVNLANKFDSEGRQTDPLMTRARILDRLRDYPGAISSNLISQSRNPEFPESEINLHGLEIRVKGNTDNARKILQKTIKTQGDFIDDDIATRLSYYLTILDIYENNYSRALEELSNWRFSEPRGRGYYPFFYRPKPFLYARIYNHLGQPEMANSYFDSTRIYIENQLREYPLYENGPMVHSCLAIVWAGLGNRQKAEEMSRKVKSIIRQNPRGFFSPLALEDLAWMYTILGDHKKAIRILRKLLVKPGFFTAKLLELDPKWDALRNLPEFQELLIKHQITGEN